MPSGRTPKLVLEGVHKAFKTTTGATVVQALAGVDLEIYPGEIYCLVGASGCGKSTIVNLIAGFERPTEGRVVCRGSEVIEPGPDRAVVFQRPNLFPWLTVEGNVMFGPRMRGNRSAARDECQRYIEAVGLGGFEERYVYELSGGMQQRVAIARALINQPDVLLMDEPFGSLDAMTRVAMQELLMTVWQELRPTILFITHDIEEGIFLGDRVGVMTSRPGRIKAEVEVRIPRPRSAEVLMSDEFVAIRRRVVELLQKEAVMPPEGRRP